MTAGHRATPRKSNKTQMKTNRTIITTAVLIAIAAIGVAALVLREPSTVAVPKDETSAKKKVVNKKHLKKPSVPARAKPAEASPVKAAKSEPIRPEDGGTAVGERAAEQPKAEDMDAEKKSKEDNPFPRYLDMFRNNPAALAAEFEKEAEADRAEERKLRDWAIDKLKLNAEQAAFLEKSLDDIKGIVLQQNQEEVDLIKSGQLNEEDAADGSIWTSNRLFMDQCVAARKKAVLDAAVELYNHLDSNDVPDSERQSVIQWVTMQTSFSHDCYEPMLQVYDKVYKNMGFGNGIFSWCKRQSQKK